MIAGAASAQATTLGDVYTAVARSSPRVIAAQAAARAAEARVPGARRPPDPQLQLGFMNYSLPDLAPMANVGMAQLQVMQMLPLGGKLGANGRAAAARARVLERRAVEVSWEVRSEAAMAFYDIYAIDRALSVDRETVRILEDIEKAAAAMYEAGQGRQADLLRAQVEIAKMAGDTLRMQSMRTSMAARLAAVTAPQALTLGSTRLPEYPTTIPVRLEVEALAVSGRPMLAAGLAEIEAAQHSETLARKELWPDLQVGLQYGQRGGEMGTERMGSLMIGASVPVFAGSRQLRMRDETAAMTAMAVADLEAMRADTKARAAMAHASLVRARELAGLYRATILPQAEATAASSLAAYRAGSVDLMTVLDARMAVNKYRKELFALAAEEGKAWAELEMLTGRELVNASSATNGETGK